MWSNDDFPKNSDVLILALDSGAGHRVRMERLFEAVQRLLRGPLSSRGLSCAMRLVADGEAEGIVRAASAKLFVLDVRDVDPACFEGRVVAIDNAHPKRADYAGDGRVFFFDTLPRPDIDERFDDVVRQVLFDDEVLHRLWDVHWSLGVTTGAGLTDQARAPSSGRLRVTFYSGPNGFLSQGLVDSIDAIFADEASYHYKRIGGKKGDGSWVAVLSRPEYLELLSSSDIVLTYPGMTFWEALLLGARPVLLESGSGVHDVLSDYLHRRVGAPYWHRPISSRMILDVLTHSLSMDVRAWDVQAWRQDVVERPGLRRLVRIVEELLHDI